MRCRLLSNGWADDLDHNEVYSMGVAVIFGGHGFIGRHLTCHLLDHNIVDRVVIADLNPFDPDVCTEKMRHWFQSDSVDFHRTDVRNPISLSIPAEIDIVFNLAAIHREPGHEAHEYYETNLPGAENVCRWAESVSCNTIVFTSSISPYGPTERSKDESSVPTPETAYGGSKLAAEKIHLVWQATDHAVRRLVILRPGVVFGAGEGGNVSRLVKAVLGRYFVYMGNQKTRKAGTYVKELCEAVFWVLDRGDKGPVLFNMSMNPGPSVQEFVEAACETLGVKRTIPRVPFQLIYLASCFIDPLFRVTGISDSFSPVRVRKLVRSNNIHPGYLSNQDYPYKYTLVSAFKDWMAEMPSEWE